MNILHTVQFYSPSVGGAQEVVRQVSEQLVKRGHTVTVATSLHPQRNGSELNGVHIKQFNISGNAVQGYRGEVDSYRDFLRNGKFDIMMNYAAQQWATDLVFPELERLPYKKVFIPCGFSALYEPDYAAYFAEMPTVLQRYNHLIFHADHYRDTDFAHQHGLTCWSIIPNGALQTEFEEPDPTFRKRYNIPTDIPLLLTIGTHTGIKGHRLVLDAFKRLKTPQTVLVIVGNVTEPASLWQHALRPILGAIKRGNMHRAIEIVRQTRQGGVGAGCLPVCRLHAAKINQQFASSKRVLLLDLPRADVIAAYHAADLFIFGSNIEYSPLVLFETLASKTPFLSLDCGNAKEIAAWTGGGRIATTIRLSNGFVDADPAIFAHEIDTLLHHPDECKLLASQGYAAWHEHFTWEKLVTKYENLYQSLL
jgi:glycosyltransferase involved in cell wall biosynthesis